MTDLNHLGATDFSTHVSVATRFWEPLFQALVSTIVNRVKVQIGTISLTAWSSTVAAKCFVTSKRLTMFHWPREGQLNAKQEETRVL